jgi:hypothetical protein
MAAVLGIVAFVLTLFVAGAFMENDLRKMAVFGAAFLACCILTLMFVQPQRGGYQDCYIDWDGRSNSTVCE